MLFIVKRFFLKVFNVRIQSIKGYQKLETRIYKEFLKNLLQKKINAFCDLRY